MPTHIALLRAVNVGRTGKLAMADLRAALADLGFTDVQTLLQSGNAVFTAPGRTTPIALESRIEATLAERFSLKTDVIVRRAAAWQKVIAANPFPKAAKDDPSHLLVLVAKSPIPSAAAKALQAAIAKFAGRETAAVVDGHLYACFPDGIGRSKLTPAVIERTVGVPVTGRNWNTVTKLAAAVGAS